MSSFYTFVPKITIIWCMLSETWSATDIFFVILGHFLPFYPTIDPKNQNFDKAPGDFILFHMCTINEDHAIYGSWDIRRDGQFFVILGNFLLFDPLNKPISQNFEKKKKAQEILSCYTCLAQMTIIWCTVPEKWSATDIIFCRLIHFFFFNKKKKRKEKHAWRYHHFTKVYQKSWSYATVP